MAEQWAENRVFDRSHRIGKRFTWRRYYDINGRVCWHLRQSLGKRLYGTAFCITDSDPVQVVAERLRTGRHDLRLAARNGG